MFSSNARANAQNRALQKSISDKYGRRLRNVISGKGHKQRRMLSNLSKEQANYIRIKRLILKGIVSVVLVCIFTYYVFSLINPILF